MKKFLGLLAICMFVGALAFSGCGGGGGGGNGTNGNTDSTTGTDGNTGVDPNSEIWGRVVRQGTTIGAANIVVQFFDGSGNIVGSATTRANGYFDADLPASAVTLHLLPSSIPSSGTSGFHRLYRYSGEWYSAIEPTCRAPLPTIVPGQLKEIPGSTIGLPLASSTPPFPDGCLAD